MAPDSMIVEYLLTSWIAVTGILIVLVIYGNALSIREDDELYLNQAEQVMMAAEQNVLIGKMNRLAHIIVGFAICGNGRLLGLDRIEPLDALVPGLRFGERRPQ